MSMSIQSFVRKIRGHTCELLARNRCSGSTSWEQCVPLRVLCSEKRGALPSRAVLRVEWYDFCTVPSVGKLRASAPVSCSLGTCMSVNGLCGYTIERSRPRHREGVRAGLPAGEALRPASRTQPSRCPDARWTGWTWRCAPRSFYALYAEREQISRRKRGFVLLGRGAGLQGAARRGSMAQRWSKGAEGRGGEDRRGGVPALVGGNFAGPQSASAFHRLKGPRTR